MKRVLTVFLQIAIGALGIGILVALLWEPHLEGRNMNSTLYQIYFDDPFLAYIYVSFITVFVGLYQAFKLVGYIGRDETYSQKSVQALRTIQYCAAAFAGLIFVAVVIIVITQSGKDDIAGGVAAGLFMIVVSSIAAALAAQLARMVSKRVRAS